jgi:cytochrome c biogenesis protein CcmG, thiol:disulfide interchange protein DsbE
MGRISWVIACAATILTEMSVGPCTVAATEVGQVAPALVVRELDGQRFDLGAKRGKVVLVDFWATWCPPCRAEMPALDAFYRRYRNRGVEMIGVSVDGSRDRAAVGKLMHALSYPAALVSDAKVNGFGMPSALPIMYVVDAHGVVRAKLTPNQGPLTAERLIEIVRPLLPQPRLP